MGEKLDSMDIFPRLFPHPGNYVNFLLDCSNSRNFKTQEIKINPETYLI